MPNHTRLIEFRYYSRNDYAGKLQAASYREALAQAIDFLATAINVRVERTRTPRITKALEEMCTITLDGLKMQGVEVRGAYSLTRAFVRRGSHPMYRMQVENGPTVYIYRGRLLEPEYTSFSNHPTWAGSSTLQLAQQAIDASIVPVSDVEDDSQLQKLLRVAIEDGVKACAEFRQRIQRGGVLETIRDSGAVLRRVALGNAAQDFQAALQSDTCDVYQLRTLSACTSTVDEAGRFVRILDVAARSQLVCAHKQPE